MKHLFFFTLCAFSCLISNSQSCPGTGAINYQRWNNIMGGAVSNLTSNPNFPNNPSIAGTLGIFETPGNTGNNIGIKV